MKIFSLCLILALSTFTASADSIRQPLGKPLYSNGVFEKLISNEKALDETIQAFMQPDKKAPVAQAVVNLSCVTITYTGDAVTALQQIAAAGLMPDFLAFSNWFWCEGGRCIIHPEECSGGGGMMIA